MNLCFHKSSDLRCQAVGRPAAWLKLLLVLFPLLFFAVPASARPVSADGLWFIRGEGCRLCDEAGIWLDDLENRYPDLPVQRLEVFMDSDARDLYSRMMTEREKTARWVPAFIYEDAVWEGFDDIIAEQIETLLASIYGEPEHLGGDEAILVPRTQPDPEKLQPEPLDLDLGFFGRVSPSRYPLLLTTLLIALVDGLNPCSIWVLTLLLAMLVHMRSRLKIALAGTVFLLVTGSVYGLFIAGVFSGMQLAAHLLPIRVLVALAVLVYAALNVKDYLLDKPDLTGEIAPAHKKWLTRKLSRLSRQQTWPVLLLMTLIVAAGAALIELPCTAGFPVAWVGLVHELELTGMTFLAYLLLYLAAYLLLEASLVIGVIIARRVFRLDRQTGRLLKLFSSSAITVMALFLLIRPALLQKAVWLLILLAVSLLLTILLWQIRQVLSRSRKRFS